MARRKDVGSKPPPKVGTTGHEWDGIEELNTPLPRWWLWLFYATIVWSIGYWIVYPAWPLVSSYSEGLFNWNTRSAVATQLAALQQERGPMMARQSYRPTSASTHVFQKDSAIIAAFARRLGVDTPMLDTAAPLFGEAEALGFGDDDVAAVHAVLARRAGLGRND